MSDQLSDEEFFKWWRITRDCYARLIQNISSTTAAELLRSSRARLVRRLILILKESCVCKRPRLKWLVVDRRSVEHLSLLG